MSLKQITLRPVDWFENGAILLKTRPKYVQTNVKNFCTLTTHKTPFLLLSSSNHITHMPSFSCSFIKCFLFLLWICLSMFSWLYCSDCLDIRAARALLDNDHYAMEKLKKRVLEYLAVRQLKTSLKVLPTKKHARHTSLSVCVSIILSFVTFCRSVCGPFSFWIFKS